jgi:hypothetical protein
LGKRRSFSWEEAIILAFRRHTLLPLDDCLYALQATIPHLQNPAEPEHVGHEQRRTWQS